MFVSWDKLTSMNLDPVGHTGRPAINQPQILRSFVLMLDRGFTSLTSWVTELQSDDLLTVLICCSPQGIPSLGSYFDFINRLWLQNPALESLACGKEETCTCEVPCSSSPLWALRLY